MSKARELAELSRTVSDSADATAITINSSEEVTFADDIFLADGKKVVLGAGSDLQIYHTGSHSYIDEQGDGNLYIGSNNGAGVFIQGSGENLITAIDDGAVTLFYDAGAKLTTTSSGIDVTGSVSANGDVESKGGNELRVYRTDNNAYGSIEYLTGAGGLKLRDVNGDGMTFAGASSNYLTIAGTGAATFSGTVGMVGGNATGKFAVSSTGVHPSYDFYNNGSSYFNGSVTVDDDLTVSGNVAISNSSGDTLTLTKSTTEPSFRIEGDSGKDFVITVSGELLTFTQNDGATDILTLDHDTGAATFTGLMGINKAVNSSVALSVGADSTSSSSYGLEVTNASANTRLLVNGVGDSLFYKTDNALGMKFDASSGNLLVSLTSTSGIATGSTANNGAYIDGSVGAVVSQSSANKNFYAAKASGYSDPDFMTFQVAGSEVGSISTYSSTIQVGQGNAFLKFANATDTITPANGNGTDNDAALSLGKSGARFKDLYLSGGVVLDTGGLPAATTNKLDSYEEGSWTPVLIAGTTNPSGGGAQSPVGAYTKIGNRVFVTFYVGRSYTNSPSGLIYISGLPFTILNSSQNNAFFNVSTYNIDFGSSGVPFGIPQHNTQTVAFYSMTSNAGWGGLEWQNHANGTIFISGHFNYIAA